MSGIDPAVDGLLQKINTPAADVWEEIPSEYGKAREGDPPRAFTAGLPESECCEAMSPAGFCCTAIAGHEGRHVAYGEHGEVCSRWSKRPIRPAVVIPHICPTWADQRWAALRRALDGQRDFEMAVEAGHPGDLYLRARAEALGMVLGMMDEIEHIIEEPA